jgi:xanthine dehydrogenase accessory factor
MFDEFLSKVSALRSAEALFAIAIVVKSEPPVSGKPGDKAIIQSDGKVWGWIGGGCVQPLVIREALNALEEGSPRLVRIAPSAASEPEAGTVNYPMSCHGGGGLEVYIEPVLPKSRILIFGRSPAAQTLSKLGKAVGYGIVVVAPESSRENFPDADFVGKDLLPGQIKNASKTFVVVGERTPDRCSLHLLHRQPRESTKDSRFPGEERDAPGNAESNQGTCWVAYRNVIFTGNRGEHSCRNHSDEKG